jgi:hypothetical protein
MNIKKTIAKAKENDKALQLQIEEYDLQVKDEINRYQDNEFNLIKKLGNSEMHVKELRVILLFYFF